MPPSLEMRGVNLTRGNRTVLQNIDLSLAACEFVGLLGGNGAGKTTLMQAILGLVPVATGQMQVLGKRPKRGNPDIGYMPQSRIAQAGLNLSGREFVAGVLSGHRWGLPILRVADRRELEWALEMVDARRLADQPLMELSGGQRRRLLLAQALIGRPRLLLLDEPLMSLDPHNQRVVVELVRRLQQEMKVTVLFSAHEINPLLSALDRVLYLGGGKAAIGTVDEVITAPVLSRLYGSSVDVIRLRGKVLVLSGEHDVAFDPSGSNACGATGHA